MPTENYMPTTYIFLQAMLTFYFLELIRVTLKINYQKYHSENNCCSLKRNKSRIKRTALVLKNAQIVQSGPKSTITDVEGLSRTYKFFMVQSIKSIHVCSDFKD